MKQPKELNWESYTKGTHRIGRIASAVVLILLIGAPFLIGGYLGAMFGHGAATPGDASFLYLLTQYKAELFLAVLFCLPLPKVLRRQYDSRPWMAIACDGLLLAVFGLSVVSITVSSFNPFIYFRF